MSESLYPWNLARFCPRCQGPFGKDSARSCRCPACGFVLFFNVGAATAALVEDEAGRLLFTVRAHDPAAGTLDLPGGFIEPDESAEEAIRREVKEELDLELDAVRYFCTVPNRYLFQGVIYHTLDVIFTARIHSSAAIKPADDVSGFCFLERPAIRVEALGLSAARLALQKYLDQGPGLSGPAHRLH